MQPPPVVHGLAREAVNHYLLDVLGEERLAAVMQQLQAAQLPSAQGPQSMDSDLDDATSVRVSVLAAQASGLSLEEFMRNFGRFLLPWSMRMAGPRHADVQKTIHQVSDTFIGFARCLTQVLVSLYSTLGSHRPPVTETHLSKVTPCSFQLGMFVAGESLLPYTATALQIFQGLLLWAGDSLFDVDVQFSELEANKLPSGILLQSCQARYELRHSPNNHTGLTAVSSAGAAAAGSSSPTCGSAALASAVSSVSVAAAHTVDAGAGAASGTSGAGGLGAPRATRVAYGLDPCSFAELFPFHLILDQQLRVVQAGQALKKLLPALGQQGVSIDSVLTMSMPRVPWSIDCLDVVLGNPNAKVVLSSLSSSLELTGGLHRVRLACRSGGADGQLVEGEEAVVFLGSPLISCPEKLQELRLFFAEIPAYDPTGGSVLQAAFREGYAAASATEALKQARHDNAALKQTLADALASQQQEAGVLHLNVESAGHLLLELLDNLLVGEEVEAKTLLAARTALLKSGGNVWRPLDVDWSTMGGDKEVKQSLARLLGTGGMSGGLCVVSAASDWQLATADMQSGPADGFSFSPGSGASAQHTGGPVHSMLSSSDTDPWQQQVQAGYGGQGQPSSARRPRGSARARSAAAYRKLGRTTSASKRSAGRSLDFSPGRRGSPRADQYPEPQFAPRVPVLVVVGDALGGLSVAPNSNMGVPGDDPKATGRVPAAPADTELITVPIVAVGGVLPEVAVSGAAASSPISSSNTAAGLQRTSPRGTSWLQSMMKSFKSGTKSPSLKGSPVTCTEGQPFSPHRQSEASVANGEQFLGTPCTSCAGPSLGPQLSVATQVLAEQLQLPTLPASHSRCQQCGALVSGSWAPVVRTSAEAATEPLPAAQGQAVQGRGVELKRSSVHVRAALPVKLLMAPFGDQVSRVLSDVDEWQWDAFALEEATGGRPLSFLAFHLISRAGLIEGLNLNATRLARFLMHVEDGYGDNPYHCRTHAADVLRSFHVLLHRGGVLTAIARHTTGAASVQSLDEDEHAADAARMQQLLRCYLAAIVHDYQHRGVNNDFLVRSSDPLALLYNDMSPLEMHHVSAALTLMHQPDFAFLQMASTQARTNLRKDIVELVLATDMKQHFALSGSFSLKLLPSSERHKNMMHRVTANGLGNNMDACVSSTASAASTLIEAWDRDTELLVLKMALKAADLGHLTSSLEVHQKWVARLEEELFLQGDRERALGQPISPLMDRAKSGIQKSQCGFFSVVAQPMYEAIAKALPDCQVLVANLQSNLSHWKEAEAAEAAAAHPNHSAS